MQVTQEIVLRGVKFPWHEQICLQAVKETADEIFKQAFPRGRIALPKNFQVAFDWVIEFRRCREIKRAIVQLQKCTVNRSIAIKFHLVLEKKSLATLNC